MRLQSPEDGRKLALRTLRKLEKAGPEKCRASQTRHARQAGAFHVALYKLLQKGSREAREGFAEILTDICGTRSTPGDLAEFFQTMMAEGRFRQRQHESEAITTSSSRQA